MRPVGTNGAAIASLITSVVGLFFCGVPSIAGLVLGIVAMRETRRTGQDGHGLAVAGTIVGAVVTVAWALSLLLYFVLVSSGWSLV
jgi:hypothetical protein